MPELIIRIKKKTDGSAALSCERADSSVTWQRQDGQLGRFFPLHDLTHYAVETVLGFDQAFFGLVASGWDISQFGGELRDQIPDEARLAESIIGFFDLERQSGERGTADDLNAHLRDFYESRNLPVPSFRITDEQVARVRERRADLFERWRTIAPGDALELTFDRRDRRADRRTPQPQS